MGAKKSAAASVVINVGTDKDLSKKPNESLVERLNKKEIHPEKIKERHDKAQESRGSSTQSQVEKASAISQKVVKAQLRAETVEAKKDKARAQKSVAASVIISVSTDKDPSIKPKKSLTKRLSREKKTHTEDKIKEKHAKAAQAKDAVAKIQADKMAAAQKNREDVKQRAGTNEAKASKIKGEASVHAAVIINVDTDYDGKKKPKKKPKKKLAKRLSLKNKPKTEKEIQARMDKASEKRDAIVKSWVENAATESKKVEEAKVRKGTDKAKEARALGEKCLAAHLKREEQKTTVINVDTGYDGKKKTKKKISKKIEP